MWFKWLSTGFNGFYIYGLSGFIFALTYCIFVLMEFISGLMDCMRALIGLVCV